MAKNKPIPTIQEHEEALRGKIEDAQYITEIEQKQTILQDAIDQKKLEHALEVPDKVQSLLRQMKPIEITLPERPAELWEYAINELNLTVSHTAKAGFALLMLKEMTPHGKFMDELQRREIPKSTAIDAMAAARLLLKLPNKITEQFGNLAGSKLIELARIPEETLEDIMKTEQLDGKPLDELDRMSVRELKATVRKLKERHAKELDLKTKDLERKDKEIVRLSSTIEEMKATELPPNEAEEAALAKLAKLQFEFDAVIGGIMMGRYEQGGSKVIIKAFHLCEYMEVSARLEAVRIRHKYPEVWESAWANDHEMACAQETFDQFLDNHPEHAPGRDLK